MLSYVRVFALIWVVLSFSCEKKDAMRPPNIVFILADDLGWADLPMYGNTFNEAPRLSQMAAEGMQFMNAYAACPVCSPTRASIQSGQYPARVGIIDFITGHWRPFEELIVPKNRTQYLPREIITIGEAMKGQGYATGYFGKWHLGWNEEHLPGKQGYDDWRVQRGGTFYNLFSKKGIFPMDSSLNDEVRLSEALTDYSVDFIRKNQENPFFLFLAHYDVHVSLDGDKDLVEKYTAKEKMSGYPSNAVYAAMIEHIDRSVGRVLDTLEELNLSENTLVVFFSDNGGLVSRFDHKPVLAPSQYSVYEGSELMYVASSNTPLRNEKGTVFEGGIREPMIAFWPGMIKAGSRSDALITSVDFYPSFLEIAGGTLPSEQEFDGESFVPFLQGNTQEKERAIFWHYPVYHHDVPAGAVRKGDFKLIQFFTDDHVELYNLREDIGETKDLSTELPQKTQELKLLLENWRTSVDARIPVTNPDFDQSRREEWGKHPDRK